MIKREESWQCMFSVWLHIWHFWLCCLQICWLRAQMQNNIPSSVCPEMFVVERKVVQIEGRSSQASTKFVFPEVGNTAKLTTVYCCWYCP